MFIRKELFTNWKLCLQLLYDFLQGKVAVNVGNWKTVFSREVLSILSTCYDFLYPHTDNTGVQGSQAGNHASFAGRFLCMLEANIWLMQTNRGLENTN
jgi:hypothetical protein